MKNILKSRLTRSHNGNDLKYSEAHIVVAGNLHTNDIIDEIISDGLAVEREMVLEVIKQFNLKIAEKVLSGYNVNTGLVSVHSEVRGLIFNDKWDPAINKIGIIFRPGLDLIQETKKTRVEIMENNVSKNEINDANQIDLSANKSSVDSRVIGNTDRYLNIKNDVPACGVAFRRWLCKA